jgi:Ca2+-binding RTX toxin-like protein
MAIINGTSGADRLLDSSNQSDTISGFAGDDTISDNFIASGRIGPIPPKDLLSDLIDGGDGNDTIRQSYGADLIQGGSGNDLISTIQIFGNLGPVNSDDTIIGGDGNDNIFAQMLNPGTTGLQIDGGAGDDLIVIPDFDIYDSLISPPAQIIGIGNSVIDGGAGFDTLKYLDFLGTSTAVTLNMQDFAGTVTVPQIATIKNIEYLQNLVTGSGSDVITDSTGQNNIINGGDGNDSITGGSGDNILYGGDGADTLDGGIGSDTLYGGGDVIFGGAGDDLVYVVNDTVTGGAGRDRFLITDPIDPLSQSYALIEDFDATEDVIRLDGPATSYRFDVSPIAGVSGQSLYLDRPNTEADQLIAVFRGNTNLSLSTPAFIFTPSLPVLTIQSTADGTEVGTPATFTLTRTGDLSQALTVALTTEVENFNGAPPGSRVAVDDPLKQAISGVDYQLVNSATFAGGSATAVVSLPILPDSIVEETEYIRLGIVDSPTLYTLGAKLIGRPSGDALVSVVDSGTIIAPPPIDVTLTVTTNASEDGTTGVFTLTRTGDLTAPLKVVFGNTIANSSATPDADYQALPGDVTFAAGSATATVNVTAINDDEIEGDETIVLALDLGNVSNNVRIVGGAAVMTLIDNDILLTSLEGGAGSDTIFGTDRNDTINGNDGDDFTYGKGGDDLMSGGNGIDNFEGNEGNDTIYGNDGDDGLAGQEGDDLLWGGNGNDRLYGWYGNDTLYGQDGNDTIFGDDDPDFAYGGSGDDWMSGGNGIDNFEGNEGNDTIFGDNGDDGLAGQEGDDLLNGWYGNDRLYGWYGNDVLQGGAGNDTLYGGSGDDRLNGDNGADIYNFGSDFITGENFNSLGKDTITGFESGSDKIQLDQAVFGLLTANISFAIVTKDNLAARRSEIIVYSQSTGNLFYNANGATAGYGIGGNFAQLIDSPLLAATDFELVPETVPAF